MRSIGIRVMRILIGMRNFLDNGVMQLFLEVGVGDGTRTRGHRGHNPVLYLLSYAHRGNSRIVVCHSSGGQATQLFGARV